MAMTVSAVTAEPLLRGNAAIVHWQNPPAADFPAATPFVAVRLVRRERLFPRDADDGETVYQGDIVSEVVDDTLQPLTTYYYKVFTLDTGANFRSDDSSTAAVYATADYGLSERLYQLLPAVYLRDDQPLGAAEITMLPPLVQERLAGLSADLRERGQLRRFLAALLRPFDLVRSFAEGLPQLRDIDRMRPQFLPAAAQSIGWELDQTLSVSRQRNEVRFAPQFYRRTGTAPSLWELVNRYTAWGAQFVEYAEHIAKTHEPPQFNHYALLDTGGVWRSRDDAGLLLGFGPGNDTASGAGSTPAELIGSIAEPFNLHDGQQFTFSIDGRPPISIVFRSRDFADMSLASVAEVADVINALCAELTAAARADGRLELVSHTLGVDSRIKVERRAAELVSIEAAPRGRLSLVTDAADPTRRWMFYASYAPREATTEIAVQEALRGFWPDSRFATEPRSATPTSTPHAVDVEGLQRSRVHFSLSKPRREIRYRLLRGGIWGPSHAVAANFPSTGEPSATQLPDQRLLCSWVSPPESSAAEVFFNLGVPTAAQPARVRGTRPAPFALRPGDLLTFHGPWADARGVEFVSADFVDISTATAIEVAAVVNARLPGITAVVQPDQTLLFETDVAGGDMALAVDFENPRAAQALGIPGSVAEGDWGDRVEFGEPAAIGTLAPGRFADLQAVTDTAGIVWLFYAAHRNGSWDIETVRWDGVAWSPPETLGAGAGGNREPHAVVDGATGNLWLVWAQRIGVGTAADEWMLMHRVFDAGTTLWSAAASFVAAPAGVADREPAGVQIASGDIRWFFRTNRAGGVDIWEVTLDPTTRAVTPPLAVTNTAEANTWPAPTELSTGQVLLLHRSDRTISRGTLGARALAPVDNRVIPLPRRPERVVSLPPSSSRSVDPGTLTRQTGSQTVALTDTARLGLRDTRLDMLSYTPAKPIRSPVEAQLDNGDLYTRGTVGLYLHQLVSGTVLGAAEQERLFAMLRRFLPINVRVVVRVGPPIFIELVYPPGADIQESYQDVYPFIERYEGLQDNFAADLPNWEVFLTNTLGHVTVDFTDLTTARRRMFFPPPL